MNPAIIKSRSLFLGLGVLCLSANSVRAADVNYNTAGDLSANFSLNVNAPTTVRYAEVPSGGLGNSGAVNMLNTLDAAHTTAVYSPGNFDFSTTGAQITFSQFILRKDATLSSTPFYQMGILSDAAERMDNDAVANSYASVRLMPDGGNVATGVFLQTETRVNGGARIRVTPGVTATLTAGHWYRFSATLINKSPTEIVVSATLEDRGTTGAAVVSTVLQLNLLTVALSGTDQVNGDPTVWAGWRTFDEGGADLVDGFWASQLPPVPAVSTWGMIFMSLLVIVAATLVLRRNKLLLS